MDWRRCGKSPARRPSVTDSATPSQNATRRRARSEGVGTRLPALLLGSKTRRRFLGRRCEPFLAADLQKAIGATGEDALRDQTRLYP
jgi:hypothetical protein